MDTNYSPSVVPSAIPSSDSKNIFIYPDPYVIPNHSPSGPYIFPYFIPDTVFPPSNLSSMSPSKELSDYTISAPLSTPVHPQIQQMFSAPYSISFQTTLYKTSKFTSLLLYPTSPSLIKYQLQLYPTSQIIIITHRIHR